MTTLKPLGGVTKRPPSALAAFAKTLNEPADEILRPQPLVLGGLKPLASVGATGGDSVKSSGQLRGLSPVKKPGEISALAAFATAAALELSNTDTVGLHAGFAAKRPAPLPLRTLAKADSKRDERQQTPTPDSDTSNDNDNTQKGDQAKEMKVLAVLSDEKAVAVVRESESETNEPQAKESSAADARDESNDDDSMAEFACMDSDEDADSGAKSSYSREDADIDDLYGHDEEADDGNDLRGNPQLRSNERIFVPRASAEPLFHAVVAEDLALLSQLLSQMTPTDVLETRDTEGRTVYHYAALSKNSRVQAVAFEFIYCYFGLELESKVTEIEAKQRRLDVWRRADQEPELTWVAPSVKALKDSSDAEVAEAYIHAMLAHDNRKRSFLHYSATNLRIAPFHACQRLRRILKHHAYLLLSKDQFDRSPLDYATMADNTAVIELWFTQLGLAASLAHEDVDRLAQLVRSKSMQALLCKLLEDADRIGFRSVKDTVKSKQLSPKRPPTLGLSVQFMTKLQNNGSIDDLERSATGGSARLWSSLHKAVIYGNADAVEALIDQGADVNACDIDGWTPLHHCAAQGSAQHTLIAGKLLDHRAHVNARSQHGRTPLHLVAMQKPSAVDSCYGSHEDGNEAEFAALLCSRGAKLELSDDDQCTPFLSAVRYGNIGVARFLLEQDCDGAVVDKTGGCALHVAAARGLEDMVRFLSRWDAEWHQWQRRKDHQGRLPRALAKSDAITLAMDNLWLAARSADPELVRQQLQLYKRHTKDKRERGKYLCVHDKTPISSRTALHLVIEGFLSATESRSPRKPKERESRAAQSITALILAGASVSAQDAWGITPLMLAACVDTPLFIENMLKKATPEDLSQQDENGNTALHYSYAFSRAQISSLLEDAMDDNEMENKLGKSPLAVTGCRQKLFPKGYTTYLTKRAKRTHDR